MKRKLCLVQIVLLVFFCTAWGEETAYVPLPAILQITQHTQTRQITANFTCQKTYPDTVLESINSEISQAVDEMSSRREKEILGLHSRENAVADTGAAVTVTGTSTASFLLVSHASNDKMPLSVEFRCFVYDMITGKAIHLSDMLLPQAAAIVQDAICQQLSSYFPDLQADAQVLQTLSGDVFSLPFTMTPACFAFHFRADSLYSGKNTLMHVYVPYKWVEDYLTETGKIQTDNSHYRTAALTFDDGPTQGVTNKMILALRDGGANATFFNMGNRLLNNQDFIVLEHDLGYGVESHTYQHDYDSLNKRKIIAYRDKFASYQERIIGIGPRMMRAPGGNDKLYVKYDVGMPIIRWNTASGDAAKKVSVSECMGTFVYTLKDHSIILAHNLRKTSIEVLNGMLQRLRDRGYLYVTVEEFFLLRGIDLQNSVVYFGNEVAE